MKKRVLTLLLSCALVLSLAACSSGGGSDSSSGSPEAGGASSSGTGGTSHASNPLPAPDAALTQRPVQTALLLDEAGEELEPYSILYRQDPDSYSLIDTQNALLVEDASIADPACGAALLSGNAYLLTDQTSGQIWAAVPAQNGCSLYQLTAE